MHFEVKSESLVLLLFLPHLSPHGSTLNLPHALRCAQHPWKYFLKLFIISPSSVQGRPSEKLNQIRQYKPKKSIREESTEGQNEKAERGGDRFLTSLLLCFGSELGIPPCW